MKARQWASELARAVANLAVEPIPAHPPFEVFLTIWALQR